MRVRSYMRVSSYMRVPSYMRIPSYMRVPSYMRISSYMKVASYMDDGTVGTYSAVDSCDGMRLCVVVGRTYLQINSHNFFGDTQGLPQKLL